MRFGILPINLLGVSAAILSGAIPQNGRKDDVSACGIVDDNCSLAIISSIASDIINQNDLGYDSPACKDRDLPPDEFTRNGRRRLLQCVILNNSRKQGEVRARGRKAPKDHNEAWESIEREPASSGALWKAIPTIDEENNIMQQAMREEQVLAQKKDHGYRNLIIRRQTLEYRFHNSGYGNNLLARSSPENGNSLSDDFPKDQTRQVLVWALNKDRRKAIAVKKMAAQAREAADAENHFQQEHEGATPWSRNLRNTIWKSTFTETQQLKKAVDGRTYFENVAKSIVKVGAIDRKMREQVRQIGSRQNELKQQTKESRVQTGSVGLQRVKHHGKKRPGRPKKIGKSQQTGLREPKVRKKATAVGMCVKQPSRCDR